MGIDGPSTRIGWSDAPISSWWHLNDAMGEPFTRRFDLACNDVFNRSVSACREARAHMLRVIGWGQIRLSALMGA